MRFHHPSSDRVVRVGYCLNLHAAETLADVRRAIESFSVPLRDRLDPGGAGFGVGMYLAAGAARALREDPGALRGLRDFLREQRIDPFTFNAFPFGGFQEDGLKARVYQPNWMEAERVDYTVDVAWAAAGLVEASRDEPRMVSISTHPGAYGADIEDRSGLRRCAEGMGRALGEFVRIEEETGVRVVLSLESEPDASARNSRALAEYLVFARLIATRVLQDEFGADVEGAARLAARHLGTCLDCCHSAVEFEAPEDSLALATHGGPLGKVQVSSALRLPTPAQHPGAREELLAMDEPRFLHQVTARADGNFLHLPDLPALSAALAEEGSPWASAEEWRCHFHVPLDQSSFGALGTTRDHADRIVDALLADPSAWSTPELHLEIETYTWSILGDPGQVVGGLEREYRHLTDRLGAAGWVAR